MQATTLKQQILPHITDIIATLKNAGYEALIVGGAVRDHLLGRRPKDYDIATTATPEEIRHVFKRKIHAMIIGRRFRLVHLIRSPEDIIEVSTFRRKPLAAMAGTGRPLSLKGAVPENMIFRDNEFGTPEEDAWRRDFTVNALFYDPVDDRLYDYTGMGLADLENHVIRAIGEPSVRFEEDPVRILRALKLAGQYGFHFDPATEAAVRKGLPLIKLASESRLNLELEKILKNPYGIEIMESFHEYGFLRAFMSWFDEHWDELKDSRRAWKIRDERMRNGAYRDSISVLISLLIMPVLKLRANPSRNDVTDAVERVAAQLLRPRSMMRRVIEAVGRTVWLQGKFTDTRLENIQAFTQIRGYSQARETAVILELLRTGTSSLEKIWPACESVPRVKRRNHRRKGGK